jgi:crossover junction endodeoxyribonuclease RusA
MKTHLSLPYPPSVNHYWRHSGGRHYIDKPGRTYRTEVWAALIRERPGRKPIEGPLTMTVVAAPPDLRYRDLDNILKALCDALKYGRLYVDDHQIIQLHVSWIAPRPDDSRVWVMVDPVDPPEWWTMRAAATLKRRRRPATSS